MVTSQTLWTKLSVSCVVMDFIGRLLFGHKAVEQK